MSPTRHAGISQWLDGRLASAAAVACLVFGSPMASAQVPVISSTPTNLTSEVDRMISYRQQEHMWRTADGALHLLMNRGRMPTVPGLALYSSFDGGSNWLPMYNWGNSGSRSTADGVLKGSDLSIVYTTLRNGVVSAQLRYDAALHSWSLLRSDTAYLVDGQVAENPTLGIDANGTWWSAFVVTDSATVTAKTLLYKRESAASTWSDSGQTFGSPSTDSEAQSPRLVPMPGGMGILVKVYDTLYWGTRSNAAATNAPWSVSTIFVSPPPAPRDPNGSHLSVVADPVDNLHLVMADDGKLLYFRYMSRTGTWGTGRTLDNTAVTSYCQISLVDDNTLAVVYNNGSAESRVMKSINRGNSFASAAQLTPTPDTGAKYTFSRIETPSYSTQPLPVLRQYEQDGLQRLMLFNVPLP